MAAIRVVLPTRVGMVRVLEIFRAKDLSSPHARGDGPCCYDQQSEWQRFSPRAWGWSDNLVIECGPECVLPTRVGMVRTFPLKTSPAWGEPIPAPDN